MPDATATFDIAPQPLDSALAAFGRQGALQVLYDARLASTRRSPGVAGRMEASMAVRQLLVGTGLEARFTGRRSVTIAASTGEAPLNAAALARESGSDMVLGPLRVEAPRRIGGPVDFGDYARLVADDLRRLLARSPGLADEVHELELHIWLGDDGRIRRVEHVGSGAAPGLAAAIDAVLLQASVSRRPPDELPQPVRVRIWTQGR